MTDLEKRILEAQDAYYNEDPIMEDSEFDLLWDELKETNPNSELFSQVGKDNKDGFPKAAHIIHMNSQEKVNTESDFIDWWNKRNIKEAIVEYKFDGISIELQYNAGKLTKAITRGDGMKGDLITNNVLKMNGFNSELNNGFTGAVRGEIVLFRDIFENKYKPQGYQNPRNMASGLSKQKDGEGCEDLNIIFYDVYSLGKNFKTEEEKWDWLVSNKFDTKFTKLVKSYDEVIDIRNKIIETRDTLLFDIDGIVIKNNLINYQDLERKRPEFQIAFKFNAELHTTKIVEIEWSLSGKILTPVAILEPVDIQGSTIKRASLANPDRFNELNLGEGDIVEITRRGEIIPRIEKVLLRNNSNRFKIPTTYDYNGFQYKLTNEGARLIIEDLNFPEIRYHRIEKWTEKIDIKGFGPALLKDLFDKRFVNDIDDLYTLDLDEYIKTTNLKKAAQKAFENLYEVKKISLPKFIAGLDIETIGERLMKLVVNEGFDTLDKIIEASEEDFSNIKGFGPERARKLKEGLDYLADLIDNLRTLITIEGEKKDMGQLGLKGLTFCFTGALDSMTRDEAFKMVEDKGGIISKAISSYTNYLVTNTPDSGSSKNKKAQSYGVQIISEVEFLKMMATR